MNEADIKAKAIVEKFYSMPIDVDNGEFGISTYSQAKQCAVISIDREIELITRLLATGLNNDFDLMRERGELKAVKQSIQNL